MTLGKSKECGFSVGGLGSNNINWKGGRCRHTQGYMMIRATDHPHADHHGYVMEHRLAMEEYLGRYLTKEELVHHKNGVKTDNRIENLQLISQPEHTRLHKHRKIKDMDLRNCVTCGRKSRKKKSKIGNWNYIWYKSGVSGLFLCHLCYAKKMRLVSKRC